MNEPIYFTDEHRQFRDNLRRFIAQEIVPKAGAWEEAGMVPREVLRQMGSLGFLGIRYPEQYGGSALDTVYSAILAEELGRSTFGGFAVTVTVHTDMASPHLANFGTPEQLERWLPDVIKGEKICASAAGSIPGPVSSISRRSRPSFEARRIVTVPENATSTAGSCSTSPTT